MVRTSTASTVFESGSKQSKINILVQVYGDRILVLVNELGCIPCFIQVTDPSPAESRPCATSVDGIPDPNPVLQTTMLMGTSTGWVEEFYATTIASSIMASFPSRPIVVGLGLVPWSDNDLAAHRQRMVSIIRATKECLGKI